MAEYTQAEKEAWYNAQTPEVRASLDAQFAAAAPAVGLPFNENVERLQAGAGQEDDYFTKWLIENQFGGKNVDNLLDNTEGAREYEAQWVEDNTPAPYVPSDPNWDGPDMRVYYAGGEDRSSAENLATLQYLMDQGLSSQAMNDYAKANGIVRQDLTGPEGSNPFENPYAGGNYEGPGNITQPPGPFPGEWNGELPPGYNNPDYWDNTGGYTGPSKYDSSGFSQAGGEGGPVPIEYGPAPTPNLTGYESSSNKDFYQQQFANMLGQEGGNDQREMAAAIRREDAANAPAPAPIDYAQMWSDVGVTPSQAVQGGTNADGTSGQFTWGLNSVFGGADPLTITNRQFLDGLRDKMPQESVNLLEPFLDNPDNAANNSWATGSSPNQIYNSLGPDLADANRNAFQDLFNAGYVRTDLQTPVGGGPTAATGYAPPVGGF